uniref:Uncharacterized protein n=1 Tax=Zea mays TaxID=4577 RepID=C0HFP0_MAIZE|nr:unknown [Zea mays]
MRLTTYLTATTNYRSCCKPLVQKASN